MRTNETYKRLKAGQCHRFDCTDCNRRFALTYEPDYEGAPENVTPEPAAVQFCPFCGEIALEYDA